MVDAADIDTAAATARADPDGWRQMTFRQRHRILDTKEGQRLIGGNPVVFELDKKLIKSLPIADRIRYAAPERGPQDVRRTAAEIGFYIARNPVIGDGRLNFSCMNRSFSAKLNIPL